MPRQQSGGVVRGGGLDPYVAAMSQQRSAQGHDMRKAAMQEQQANKRQGMANDAQVAQSNIQAAAAKQMQDRRAAEAEVGRREDHEYRMVENKLADTRQAERDRLLNNLAVAREQRSIDRVTELYQEVKAQERYSQISDLTSQDNTIALAKKQTGIQGKAAEGFEKIDTWWLGEKDKHEQLQTQGDIIRKTLDTDLLNPDSIFNTTFDSESIGDKISEKKMQWAMTASQQLPGAKLSSYTAFDEKKLREQLQVEEMSTGVDKFLHSSGIPAEVSINQFEGESLKEFEELVKTGKVKGEDIFELKVVVEKAFEHYTKLANSGINKRDKSAYTEMAGKMANVETQLLRLKGNKTNIEEQVEEGVTFKSQDTIGKEITRGLGYARMDLPTGEYDRRRAEIQREEREQLKKLGTPEEQRSVFPTRSSRHLNPMDLANPLLMNMFVNDEGEISKMFPDDLKSPRTIENFLGEGTMITPPPVQGAKTRFNTETQSWDRR